MVDVVPSVAARPFAKFVGGKTQLLPELDKVIPSTMGAYYEPFVGGGALFWHLANKKAFHHAVLNDMNKELVEAYRVIREDTPSLMRKLSYYEEVYKQAPEQMYYQLRARTKDELAHDVIQRAARFIFLNKSCFNGLYRVNKAGGFNVPWGKKAEVRSFDGDILNACHAALKDVEILNVDFQEVAAKAGEGDVVYFDPPYLPVSKTSSFDKYTKGGFGPEEHCRLAEVAHDLAAQGATVVISNADTPEVREIFRDGFEVHEVRARRNVNSVGEGRGKIGELILVARG